MSASKNELLLEQIGEQVRARRLQLAELIEAKLEAILAGALVSKKKLIEGRVNDQCHDLVIASVQEVALSVGVSEQAVVEHINYKYCASNDYGVGISVRTTGEKDQILLTF